MTPTTLNGFKFIVSCLSSSLLILGANAQHVESQNPNSALLLNMDELIVATTTRVVKMLNGSDVCSADLSMETRRTRSKLDCVKTCSSTVKSSTTSPRCLAVNFVSASRLCQMYSNWSINYRTAADCQHIQAGVNRELQSCLAAVRACYRHGLNCDRAVGNAEQEASASGLRDRPYRR